MTKPPTPTGKSKKQHDNTKRHQKLRLHNDYEPTSDGQLSREPPNWCDKPVNGIIAL